MRSSRSRSLVAFSDVGERVAIRGSIGAESCCDWNLHSGEEVTQQPVVDLADMVCVLVAPQENATLAVFGRGSATNLKMDL